jgi:cysteine-rich repeat protein
MKHGHWLILGALALAMAAPLSGCGDNDNDEVFLTCGDGVVNSGEECDDGNTLDTDACLTSCLNARCGDGFIRTGVEECDGSNLNGESCTSQGQQNGTLTCNACQFDTAGCGGNPVPTATPVVGVPTSTPATSAESPTPTPATSGDSPTPTPTATPPPGGPVCGASETVTLDLTVNIAIGGVQLEIPYPASVRIQGTGADAASAATFPPGFVNANDKDTDGDLVDDQVDFAWASSGGTFTDLATIEFECVPGQPRPTASAFTCTIKSASDDLGTDIAGVVCTITER